jgi:hypothetical protein
MAPKESQGGQVNSAAEICIWQKLSENQRAQARGGTVLSICKMLTFLYRFITFESSKGKYPASNTKSITPHDHKSAVVPS